MSSRFNANYEILQTSKKSAQAIGSLGPSSDKDPELKYIEEIQDEVRAYVNPIKFSSEKKSPTETATGKISKIAKWAFTFSDKGTYYQIKKKTFVNKRIMDGLAHVSKTATTREAFFGICQLAHLGRFPDDELSVTKIDEAPYEQAGKILRQVAFNAVKLCGQLESLLVKKSNKYNVVAKDILDIVNEIFDKITMNIKKYQNWQAEQIIIVRHLDGPLVRIQKDGLELKSNQKTLQMWKLGLEPEMRILKDILKEISDLESLQALHGPTPPSFIRNSEGIPQVKSLSELEFEKRYDFPRNKFSYASLLDILRGNPNLSNKFYEGPLPGPHPVKAGGFAHIFQTQLPGTNKKVAVKMMKSADIPEWRVCVNILREVEAWHQIEHENILPLEGIWISPGEIEIPGMISPWSDIGSLRDVIDRMPKGSNGFGRAEGLQMALGIIRGLAHIHSLDLPLIHRDLKAANVIVLNNVPRISDFGISRLHKVVSGCTTNFNWSCRWTAPELFSCASKSSEMSIIVQKPSDIFAFGGVLLEIFTGDLPYKRKTNEEYIMNSIEFNRVTPAEFPPECHIDPDLWDFMKRCWDIDPTKRPTAAEALDHIEQLQIKPSRIE